MWMSVARHPCSMHWQRLHLRLSNKGRYVTYFNKPEHDNCQIGTCAGDGQSDTVGGGAHVGCSMLLDGCHGRDPENDSIPQARIGPSSSFAFRLLRALVCGLSRPLS